MEIEKSKVSIHFPLIFRQSGDVLFILYARRLGGYTATVIDNWQSFKPTKTINLTPKNENIKINLTRLAI